MGNHFPPIKRYSLLKTTLFYVKDDTLSILWKIINSIEQLWYWLSQVDKVKNLRGGVQFPFQRGGGVNFSFHGGVTPPSTQKTFRLRHLLHFKVVRPPVINLWCGSYSFALPLKNIVWLKGFDPNSRVRPWSFAMSRDRLRRGIRWHLFHIVVARHCKRSWPNFSVDPWWSLTVPGPLGSLRSLEAARGRNFFGLNGSLWPQR